ncbi:hypothetical protein ATANTOWER_009162 [Ataeniobius toweri]|uniref:Uncharacterized protein n=1 Tax=Ataeniobius toweri TaxID=208326 RepID=A0ABU7AEY4_9TELE|nr:hypothetical protein [Ataeniobius toweri]
MDPETRDPGTHHSPSRGPAEPRGPGPGKQPPGVSRHTPNHPAPDTENHKYTNKDTNHRQVVWRAPYLMGGPKLIQEREQSKTQPDTKNRHTQSQSHIPTLVHTHKNTHTHAPNVKTNINGCHTPTHTPHTYSILPGPGANTP